MRRACLHKLLVALMNMRRVVVWAEGGYLGVLVTVMDGFDGPSRLQRDLVCMDG